MIDILRRKIGVQIIINKKRGEDREKEREERI
jgi:hypothetical protein